AVFIGVWSLCLPPPNARRQPTAAQKTLPLHRATPRRLPVLSRPPDDSPTRGQATASLRRTPLGVPPCPPGPRVLLLLPRVLRPFPPASAPCSGRPEPRAVPRRPMRA